MSVQIRIDVTTVPTAGILKDLPSGKYDLIVLDHQILFAAKGQGPNKGIFKAALTSDTPQLIKESDTINGVEILQLRVRMR